MGCRKAIVHVEKTPSEQPLIWKENQKYLIHIDAAHLSTVQHTIQQIPDGSMMIVQDIYHNVDTAAQWKDLTQNDEPRIVFDLYHCGILFFDKKRYKQYYTINF